MAAFKGGAVSTGSTSAGTSKTITYSPTAGNTLLVFGAGVGVAVSNVTDNAAGGSSTYSKLAGPSTNTVEGEMWGTAVGGVKSGVTTITVTFASSTRNAVGCAEYTSVNAYGNVNNSATGSSTSPQASVTTQDNNNIVVCGMSREGTSTWSTNSGVGTLRESLVGAGTTTPGIGISDNTAASPGSVTAGATISSSGNWCACAVELRSVSPIAATINRTATVAAALKGAGALQANATGHTAISANLTGSGTLATLISGHGTVSATGFTSSGNLACVISGKASVTATLKGTGKLSSTISRSATVVGTLKGTGVLGANIQGKGTVVSTAKGSGKLMASVAAHASITAVLGGSGVSGNSVGISPFVIGI